MVDFRVVTGSQSRPFGRKVVWYVERRSDDGYLGIVGLLHEKKADAEAISKELNDDADALSKEPADQELEYFG